MDLDNKIATRESFGKALVELGKGNENVVVLTADLAGATKTSLFEKEFPDRFINVGIAEQNMIGISAGLATTGKIPFASTFAMFAAGRAYDQIRNSVAYPKLNVKICGTHAGVTVGEDGATHQMLEDLSLMRSIPNMTVLCTSDDVQTKWAIKEMAKIDGPVYIRLARVATPVIYDENQKFEIGKMVQIGDGTDATVFATGVEVAEALKAKEELEKENINTLTMTSEFMIALYGSFAQAESESISQNVSWGKQKAFAEGKVSFQYKHLLGYRRGADGKPEIVPEEAETVRMIYELFLDGYSLTDIAKRLTLLERKTAHGKTEWHREIISSILRNEKYVGDALLQKTFRVDCISKKVRKNNGERPMYLVTNHHEPIIDRDTYNRVQQALARRTSKRKISDKTITEQGKYTSKWCYTKKVDSKKRKMV